MGRGHSTATPTHASRNCPAAAREGPASIRDQSVCDDRCCQLDRTLSFGVGRVWVQQPMQKVGRQTKQAHRYQHKGHSVETARIVQRYSTARDTHGVEFRRSDKRPRGILQKVSISAAERVPLWVRGGVSHGLRALEHCSLHLPPRV